MTERVAVVGGGIAGLTAAYEITAARPDVEVVVLEASDCVGGKVARAEVAGVMVDVGAEAMLNRRPEAVDMARRVGLDEALVHPQTTSSAVWTRGAVRALPPTVMGVPSDPQALARSGVLSRRGALRARAEVALPVPEDDVSVAGFLRPRVGGEVVDRLVEPLLGGVYAGHASTLSLRAAAPQIAQLADRGGRVTRAAARTRHETAASATPVFAGLVGGVGRLTQAMADAPGARIRVRATVRELRAGGDGRWSLLVGPTTEPERVEADAVVLAVPGPPAGRLLASAAPGAARVLRELEYASTAVVTLAVARGALGGGTGVSGFLVPPVDGRTIKAVTYSSRKWSWLERAIDDLVVLRCSIGRAGDVALLQRDDDELVALAMDDLAEAVGLRGPLVDAHVQRWGGALPQYAVGHLDRMRTVHAAVAAVDGLEVCGAAYRGVGIPAVIETAQHAAARTLSHLSRR